MRKILLVLFVAVLVGCTNNGAPVVDSSTESDFDEIFVGLSALRQTAANASASCKDEQCRKEFDYIDGEIVSVMKLAVRLHASVLTNDKEAEQKYSTAIKDKLTNVNVRIDKFNRMLGI